MSAESGDYCDAANCAGRALNRQGAWILSGGRKVAENAAFGIMGIINLTPDSFFDGGKVAGASGAVERAGRLVAEGADILDLGAESSRPGADFIGAEEEAARLAPALSAIARAFPDAVISVDTWRAGTAALALENGAAIINDISAFGYDAAIVEALVQHKPGYVLMHSLGQPQNMQRAPAYEDVVSEVKFFFDEKINRLLAAGLPEERIVLDVGIGFGKKLAHNLELLRRIDEFLEFGRPILAGISMKSMFGDLLGLPLEKRGPGSATLSALLWQKGVFWHRMHNVSMTRDALRLAAALR